MSRLLLVMGMLFGSLNAWAQGSPVVFDGQPVTKHGLDIRPYSQFFADSSSETPPSLAWVQQQPFQEFKSGLQYRWDSGDLRRSRQQAWLRFSITNTNSTDTIRLLAHTGVHADITQYELSRTDAPNLSRGGFLWRWDIRPLGPMAFPVVVPPQATRHYYIRVVDLFQSFDEFKLMLFTHQDFELWNAYWVQIAAILFGTMAMMLGCLLLMSTYTLYQYYLNRDQTFLYYALYAATALVWVLKMVNSRFGLGL